MLGLGQLWNVTCPARGQIPLVALTRGFVRGTGEFGVNGPRKGGNPPAGEFARGKRRKRRRGRRAQGSANSVPAVETAGAAADREDMPAAAALHASKIGNLQASDPDRPGERSRTTGSSGAARDTSRQGSPKRGRLGKSGGGASAAHPDQPAPARRRRKPHDGQASGVAPSPAEAGGSDGERRGRETTRQLAGNSHNEALQGRGRRRKRRRAKAAGLDASPGGDAPGALRYLRAPAKAAPRPSFDPSHAGGASSRSVKAEPGNGSKTAHAASGAKHGRFGGRRQPGQKWGGQARASRQGIYAALDLGTNNCRLLVAVPMEGERFRVIDAFSRIVRLGEGLAASGRLSAEAMDRAIEALAICAAKMASHELAGMRLIATEACRRAVNGADFLDRVFAETGLRLEIVDRQTEARLAAEGCGSLMDRRADGAVLFDIGGGSSELVLINRSRARGRRISEHIAAWTSIQTGVVTLSERHGGHHVTRAGFDDMVADVLDQLTAFEGRQALSDIWHPARTHLLGTSGTVTTIAGVHLKLPRYDRRKVDGIWLSDGQIDDVIEALVAMDYEERAQNPCIGRERADLVLAGCAILQAIRLTWPSPRLRVADRGLREGILADLMHAAGEWPARGNGAGRRGGRRHLGRTGQGEKV